MESVHFSHKVEKFSAPFFALIYINLQYTSVTL